MAGRFTTSKLRYQQAMESIEKDLRAEKYRPGQKLPSMKDIARELGIGFVTARRALQELEHKGLLAIRHGAGTFVAEGPVEQPRKTVRIALAFRVFMMDTDGTHPALGAYLAGAHQRCTPGEYVVQSLFYGENRFTQDIGQALLDEQINGVVVFDGPLTEEDSRFLRDHHIHVAVLSYKAWKDDWVITITHDCLSALSQAMEHLRSLGHKRIGLISFTNSLDDGALHRHFARLAFEHRLGDPKELLTLVNDAFDITRWGDVENFFRISPAPTAVVVTDEFLADIVLDGCERRGIKVPDQLSLVALMDARPLGHRIPLTTIITAEDLRRRAALSCDLLIKRIAGQPIPEPHVMLESKLVVKASTGPAPVPALERVSATANVI